MPPSVEENTVVQHENLGKIRQAKRAGTAKVRPHDSPACYSLGTQDDGPEGMVRITKSYAETVERLYKMFRFSKLNLLRVPIHRYVGLFFMVQFVAAILLFNVNYEFYMNKSFLWFTLSFSGVLQSATAGYYFRHETPKKALPQISIVQSHLKADSCPPPSIVLVFFIRLCRLIQASCPWATVVDSAGSLYSKTL